MRIFYKTLLALSVVTFSALSNATLVTTNGSDFSFTYDDLLIRQYGTPNVTGNSLFFVPSNLLILQENVKGDRLLKSDFTAAINSLQGHKVDLVVLNVLEGEKANVSLPGKLTAITEFEPFSTFESKIASTRSFGHAEFSGQVGQWEGSSLNDLPNSTSAIVTMENALRTKIFSGNKGNELALIKLKLLGIFIGDLPANTDLGAFPVPLPQVVWLFGAGMFGLLSFSKRKKFI